MFTIKPCDLQRAYPALNYHFSNSEPVNSENLNIQCICCILNYFSATASDVCSILHLPRSIDKQIYKCITLSTGAY